MSISIIKQIKYLPLLNQSKGKGRAGKQVGSQKKGKEPASKRAQRCDTDVEDEGDSEGEGVGEKGEKPVGCFLTLLT